MRAGKHSRFGFTFVELLAVVVVIGALTAIAVPRIRDAQEKAKVARSIGDIRAMQIDLAALDSLPPSLAAIGKAGLLDPWGHPYLYLKFPDTGPPPGARLDRFLVPLNTTYDLYSLGADGQTMPALSAASSLDDVVRGIDGGFIGRGSTF